MRSFGDAVTSLLDVYTKCLSLLQEFTQDAGPRKSQRKLDSSIRSDRARVRRVYSTSLSQQGDSFQKGDATARSSLRQVVKKLTDTIERLIRRMTGKRRQALDYEALALLSNASRADAIRTMSDLSRRVASQTSLTTRSSRSRHSSNSRPHGHAGNTRRRPVQERPIRDDSSHRTQRRRLSKSSSGGSAKRASMVTASSDSTKLGEVRPRRRLDYDPSYAQRPTYPLYAPHSREPENRKTRRGWFGLF